MFRTIGVAALAAGLLVCLSPLAARAAHDFKISNKGDHQIDHVYLSPISRDKWGPDQLDSDQVIPAGDHVTWSITNGCEQDVKVVYHNGHTDIERDFDTCKYDLELSY